VPRIAAAARGDAGPAVAAVILIAIIAILVLPPLWFLAEGSLHLTTPQGGLGAFTIAYYRDFLGDRRFLDSLRNSFVFAVGSASIAIVLGGVIAWLAERTNTPWKPLARLTAVIALGTPYLIYVTAWLFLLGRNGPISELVRTVAGTRGAPFDVYSLPGMIVVEGLLWSPMAFLLLAPIFRQANADFEEAARVCGAGIGATIRSISMRLALPALLAVGLLSVIRALEAFEVPALIGIPGKVYLLTTAIYLDAESMPPALGRASAFAVFLLVVAALLLSLYARLSRNAARFQTVTGRGFRPRTIDLGRWRWAGATALLVNFVLVLGLPTAGLLWLSLVPFTEGVSRAAARTLTVANFRTVLGSPADLKLVWQTIVMAAASATAAMVLTTPAAWLAVRRRPGGLLLDQLATLPLVFPGIVLGVAMMQMFLAAPVPLYGTLAGFVVAFTVRYMPYGMRYAYAGMIAISTQLEEAAQVAGATFYGTFRRVVVPLSWPSVTAGWLFIFLLAARDLSLAVLLASPSTQPVAVAMLDLWVNGQGPELAAFGLAWTSVMAVVAMIFYWAGRRATAAFDGSEP
jgi:iron(III) transport system permease protein